MKPALATKAYFRLIKAQLAIRAVEEARKSIDAALSLEIVAADSASLAMFQAFSTQCDQIAEQLQQEEERKKQRSVALNQQQMAVIDAIRARQIQLIASACDVAPSRRFPAPIDFAEKPVLTEDGVLCWPALLIYPQLGTFDLIQAWPETTRLSEMLDEVTHGRDEEFSLGDEDPDFRYNKTSLAVYAPSFTKCAASSSDDEVLPAWKRVRTLATLAEVLRTQAALVDQDLVVRLWVVPSSEGRSPSNAWTREWLKESLKK
jgi:hypothetical protein